MARHRLGGETGGGEAEGEVGGGRGVSVTGGGGAGRGSRLGGAHHVRLQLVAGVGQQLQRTFQGELLKERRGECLSFSGPLMRMRNDGGRFYSRDLTNGPRAASFVLRWKRGRGRECGDGTDGKCREF